MHKATVALVTFVVFFGCNADSPTSPGAAKYTEAEAEQCPMPILGIAGTWVELGGPSREYVVLNGGYIITADTLWIEFAPDPNPAGEPGVTYYDYTRLSYFPPSDGDDLGLAELDLPSLYREERGKMGVYYADSGKWAFNRTVTHIRGWNEETKEYEEWWEPKEYEEEEPDWLSWGHEIKMFDGWLVLGHWWDNGWGSYLDVSYRRVDE